jgi:DNA polymerase III alpha subunit
MFITLEDETGIANLVVWPQVFEKYRRVVMGAGMIAMRGRIQREGGCPPRRPSAHRSLGRTRQHRRA